MAKRDNHQAARALADWAQENFREAQATRIADTYNLTTRTLWRWKAALDTDTELSGLFRQRLNDILDKDWAAHLGEALSELVERIRTLAATEDSLAAVVEAFRALSEVEITREVLSGAANAEPHRGHEAQSGQAQAIRSALN